MHPQLPEVRVRPGPEIAFVNGTVFDGSRFLPAGTAVRVRGATIAAVGLRAGASRAGGREPVDLAGAEPVDLGGGTLLPGFIDAHVHPVFAGDQLVRCDLSAVITAAEYLDIIAAYAAAHPEAEWITGGGWSMQ